MLKKACLNQFCQFALLSVCRLLVIIDMSWISLCSSSDNLRIVHSHLSMKLRSHGNLSCLGNLALKVLNSLIPLLSFTVLYLIFLQGSWYPDISIKLTFPSSWLLFNCTWQTLLSKALRLYSSYRFYQAIHFPVNQTWYWHWWRHILFELQKCLKYRCLLSTLTAYWQDDYHNLVVCNIYSWTPYHDWETVGLVCMDSLKRERCVSAGLWSTLPHALKRRQRGDGA